MELVEKIFRMILSSIVLCVIAFSISLVGKKWIESISQNPESKEKIFTSSLIVVCMIAAAGIIALILLFI